MSDDELDPDEIVAHYFNRWGISPDPASAREIRDVLDQSSAAGCGTLAKFCCDLLFLLGDPADCLAVWRSKFRSRDMDVGCMVDIESMCPLGLDGTIAWLRASDDPDAPAALADLQQYMDSGHFDDDEDGGAYAYRDGSFGPFNPTEWAAVIAHYWTP